MRTDIGLIHMSALLGRTLKAVEHRRRQLRQKGLMD